MSLSTFNYTKYTSEGLAYISNLKFIMGHYSVFVMTNIRKKNFSSTHLLNVAMGHTAHLHTFESRKSKNVVT